MAGVGGQGVGRPSGPGERGDQERDGAFAPRVGDGQRVEVRRGRFGLAEGEQGGGALLPGGQPHLLQAGGLGPGEVEPGQGGPPPQAQRLLQQAEPGPRVAGAPGAGHQRGEALGVHAVPGASSR
nr:hypothetical protein GCM10020093_100480 [Planobispora longispora]